MSSQDFIKYLVQEMVKYMNTPKQERKEARLNKRMQKPTWSHRWFGMVPFGVKMYTQRQKNRWTRRDS